jgi:hypothetical protein
MRDTPTVRTEVVRRQEPLWCGFDLLVAGGRACVQFQAVGGKTVLLAAACLNIGRRAHSRPMICSHCALHNKSRPVSNSHPDLEHTCADWRQQGFRFAPHAGGSVNWLRRTNPKVLAREPLVSVRRARDLITVAMHAALTAYVPTKAQTSRVVVSGISPGNGIRAFEFVERHRTER